jgi:hypothetical protein
MNRCDSLLLLGALKSAVGQRDREHAPLGHFTANPFEFGGRELWNYRDRAFRTATRRVHVEV